MNLRETTLDEPIITTIWRDVKRVLTKLFHVMVPRTFSRHSEGVESLRDWDLWGPLIICMCLSIFLYIASNNGQATVFAASFVLVSVGSAIITLNALLLGGTLSFFQSVSILGYCLFPLMVASFICLTYSNIYFRLAIVTFAIGWAMLASVGFFAGVVPDGRRVLALYPVILFYVVIGWMIILGTFPSSGPTLAPTIAPTVAPVAA